MTTATTVNVRLKLRADTAANWTSANPTLLSGEMGLETDTNRIKIGNGSTAWSSLAYFPFVVSGGTVLGNLEIGTTGTLTFEGSVADGFETTLGVVNPTADRTINLPNQSGTVIVSGNASIVDADISATAEIAVSKLADGAARQLLQTDAAGTGVEWASNIDIPGTLDVTSAATFDSSVTVQGDLTVNGTTTTISTQNLLVEDKNIVMGDVATPTDVTADGGGITLKGATDKTITWIDATDAWTSSERFSYPLGSAAAPALTFTGDPNTGIYSPGADQLAISTGGTGRLFVDASGRLSLGTASTSRTAEFYTASGNNGLRIANGGDTASDYGVLDIVQGASQKFVLYTNQNNTFANANTGAFIFQTGAVERMRLDSSGGFQFKGAGTAGVTQAVSFNGSAPVNSLVIDSSGRLGAGTSSPEGQLTVFGAGQATTAFNTSSNLGGAIFARDSGNLADNGGAVVFGASQGLFAGIKGLIKNGNSNTSGDLAFLTRTASADATLSPKLYITAAGNVGIGTASPEDTLHVTGSIRTEGNIKVLNSGALNLGFNQGGGAFLRYNTNGDLDIAPRSGYSTVFLASDGGTERARIDSSGRLLVGTSTTASVARVVVQGISIDPNALGIIQLQVGTTTPADAVRFGRIDFTDSANGTGAWIQSERDGGTWTSGSSHPGRLLFSTTADGASSPTEALRIINSGRHEIGSAQQGMLCGVTSGAGTATAIFVGKHSITRGSVPTTGTDALIIWSNGNVVNTNNSYGAISDIKLKENIVDANSQWNDLKALQVRNYNFKEGQTHTQIGLVAQEVELVSPGLVSESPDRDDDGNDLGTTTKSVNYSVLYMKAVKALQEAMERIETLEAKVAALEGV